MDQDAGRRSRLVGIAQVKARFSTMIAAFAALQAGSAHAQSATWSVDPAPCSWGCSYTNGPAKTPAAPPAEPERAAAPVAEPADDRASIYDALATSRPTIRATAQAQTPKSSVRANPAKRAMAQAARAPEARTQPKAQDGPKRVARSEAAEAVRPQPAKPTPVRVARPAPLVEPHANGLVTRRSVARTRAPVVEPAAPGLVKQPEIAREAPDEAPAPVAADIEIRLRPPEWDRRVMGAQSSVAAPVGPYGALTR